MMIAVAVAALLLSIGGWLWRRSQEFHERAVIHLLAWRSNDLGTATGSAGARERAAYHLASFGIHLEGSNMRRVCLFTAAASLLFAAVFSLASAREVREAGVNATQDWEYRLIVLTDVVSPQKAALEPTKAFAAFEVRFNELGREKWEYCGYLNGAAVFKRPKL
jgi:hypothetical protein